MEPPTDLGADSIRDEKVKVVRSLRRWSRNEIAVDVVRAQYAKGAINGEPAVGYRQEKNVNPDSLTETFVALRLYIDTWRWADVPIYCASANDSRNRQRRYRFISKKRPRSYLTRICVL